MKTEIISNDLRGLEIYAKPFVFQVRENKKEFYYSEIGILVSCRYYPKTEDYSKTYRGKFAVNVQYDYRSADDLSKFGFVKNTGTYGIDLFAKTLEEAMQMTLDFIESEFTSYRAFGGEKLKQKNKASIREVAKSQSLHHLASFSNLWSEDNIYLTIVKNAGEFDTLMNYRKVNENRHNAELKYQSKLSARFSKDFGVNIRECAPTFTFRLGNFQTLTGLNAKEDLNKNQKNTLQHALKYYR